MFEATAHDPREKIKHDTTIYTAPKYILAKGRNVLPIPAVRHSLHF